MIELDDVQWDKLTHAYGKATDIPELIKALENHPESTSHQSEPYYSLWSALCHQGDSYSASIVALPYLVQYCENAPNKAHWSIAQLFVCIEISRLEGRCSDDISDELYKKAVKKFVAVIDEMKNANPNENIDLIGKAAAFAYKGNWEQADAVFMED